MPILARARWAWSKGDRAEALRLLREIRREGAHSAPALANAALLCLEMGEAIQAQAFLNEAARYQPRYIRDLLE